MVRIAPFRGLLYNPAKIRDPSKVIAPPYDVITPEEQERLYKKSPYNIVRLILNRDSDGYEDIARLFESWQAEDIFVRAETPAIYFLRHRFVAKEGGERERQGFIALTRIEDFSTGRIRPHERTLEGPKEDRFRLLLACHANLSPIFGLYCEPKQSINRILAKHVEGLPSLIQAREDRGGTYLFWSITDPEVIRRVQREIADQELLIADGHHRYEAALNYRDHWRRERSRWSGREGFNYVMMYFANLRDEDVVILPTHRLVRGFEPIPFQQLDEALQRYFYLEPYPKTREGQKWFLQALRRGGRRHHLLGVSFKGDPRFLILRLKTKRSMQRLARDMNPSLRELDVTILHRLILGHILGVSLERQAQENVLRYLEDEEQALAAVEKEDYQAAFILNPCRPEEILAVTLSGDKMPQKSTYFYPKLPTGLVINKIDLEEEIVEWPGEIA